MKTRRLPTPEDRTSRELESGETLENPVKALGERATTIRPAPKRQTARRSTAAAPPAVPRVVIPALLAGARTVRFCFTAPNAKEVFLAGTFNDWQPGATPLLKAASGGWQCEKQLPPGDYEYRFVVDGTWQDDPEAERSVPNPFGGLNSLITVS